MKRIVLKKGLNVPISGEPNQSISPPSPVSRVALIGDDYIGMKPTMEVAVGDPVKTGQLLFRDKKNEGVIFTSPATGKVVEINRGAKRKFESIIIETEEDDFIQFLTPGEKSTGEYSPEEIRSILINSSLWTGFRTRPFGKVPEVASTPTALFITATDTRPLAADPGTIINLQSEDFSNGIDVLRNLIDSPIFLCLAENELAETITTEGVEVVEFEGPHPAGLPSTHIHFLQPAQEGEIAWHIDYQDVIGIGCLFRTGRLPTEKVISLAGPAVLKPELMTIRIGSDIYEICKNRLVSSPNRILSGSVLDGRQVKDFHHFIGRYHNQISVLHERSGRGLFSWASPGGDRFSVKRIFTSTLDKTRKFAMNTALWGGERAIFPIDSYDRVMPMDILPLPLLKSLSTGDTEKSKSLGALELIEEDVALLSYVCPGKNDFGPILRDVLTEIELEG